MQKLFEKMTASTSESELEKLTRQYMFAQPNA